MHVVLVLAALGRDAQDIGEIENGNMLEGGLGKN